MIRAATWTFVTLLVAAAVTGVIIVMVRTVRLVTDRRRARLAAEPRRRLLALLAEAEAAGTEFDGLVALPNRSWRAVEPVAVALLAKVRGEALDALAAVFERRGIVGRALGELTARGAVRRARAAEVLGSLRTEEAVPGLCHLLDDVRPEVRLVAARALGRIGAPAAAQPLLDTLARPHPAPSHLITHALVQLRPEASPALVAALDRPDPAVRLTALSALRLRGTGGAEPRVVEALRRDPATEVRIAAAALLGRLGTRAAVAPLVDAVDPAQPVALRAEACRALGELGAPVAVTALTGLLADRHHPVAHQAAAALVRLGGDGRKALEAAGVRPDRAGAHAREALGYADLLRAAPAREVPA